MDRVLFATGVVELLRPLFVRWASEEAIATYETVVATLRRTDAGAAGASALRARIEALPESEFDDSHYRDFYVMMALGVLLYGSSVALSTDADASDEDARELETVVDSLARELDLDGPVAQLRSEATGLEAGIDQLTAKAKLRARADELTPLVHDRLDDFARRRRWSLDRVRPRPGEASTRFLSTDAWAARRNYGSVREHATFDEVEVALIHLDAKMWTMVTIGEPDSRHMVIGGGAGQYVVYVASAGEEELWDLIAAQPKDGRVLLTIGGQEGDYPARQVVGLEEARTAARTFFLTGALDATLRWELP